jgi:hypothetical protein
MLNFPEACKVVWVGPGNAANALGCDYICTKNLLKVWFLVKHKGANDTDLTLGLTEATDVAAGTNAAVTATFPIWVDADHGTSSDLLVRQTDAASYVIDPALYGNSLVVIEWDPVKHSAGYDCIAVTGTNGHGSNIVNIVAIGELKYQSASPPSIIID